MRDLEAVRPAEGPPKALRTLASWLLNQARVAGDRLVATRLGQPGLRTDYAVLATLAEFGPSSQATIGRRLGLDRSDVVALLNRLGAQDLVHREPDPSDRRRNTVVITDGGRTRLREMGTASALAQDDLLAPLAAEERVVLVELLQRVVAHHRAGSGDAG